jgi:hypothetical protein
VPLALDVEVASLAICSACSSSVTPQTRKRVKKFYPLPPRPPFFLLEFLLNPSLLSPLPLLDSAMRVHDMTTRDEVGRCSHLSKGIELSRLEIFQAGRERERERGMATKFPHPCEAIRGLKSNLTEIAVTASG